MITKLPVVPAWWAAEWDRCISPVQQRSSRRGTGPV